MIYIDISEFLRTRLNTGIQRVLTKLLHAALERPDVQPIYYDQSRHTFKTLPPAQIAQLLAHPASYRLQAATPIELLHPSRKGEVLLEVDTVWNATPDRAWLYPRLKACGIKIVNLIYDLIPLLHPDYMYAQTRRNFPGYIKALQHYSDAVVCDSKAAQKDFNALPSHRTIPTAVIYPGADFQAPKPLPRPKSYKTLLNQKYLLFVGTLEPRKRHDLLLQSFNALRAKDPDLHLIFAGRVGWGVEKLLARIHRHPSYNKTLFHLQDLSDTELFHFYQNAFLVLYLSEYEGYGLPVAEAIGLKKLTLVSRNTALTESGTRCAHYLKNHSKATLISTITKYTSKKFHKNSAKILKKCEFRTWSKFSADMFSFCNSII